jgi:hypothetical protein
VSRQPTAAQALKYIQGDLQQLKHAIDTVLRPFRSEVKQLRVLLAASQEEVRTQHERIFKLMRLVELNAPHELDNAIELLVDPARRGFKRYKRSWYERLGKVER